MFIIFSHCCLITLLLISTELINIRKNSVHYFSRNYAEFRLSKDIDMNHVEMKNLIITLNQKPKTKAYYNSVTKNCDTIYYLDNTRYIDSSYLLSSS